MVGQTNLKNTAFHTAFVLCFKSKYLCNLEWIQKCTSVGLAVLWEQMWETVGKNCGVGEIPHKIKAIILIKG